MLEPAAEELVLPLFRARTSVGIIIRVIYRAADIKQFQFETNTVAPLRGPVIYHATLFRTTAQCVVLWTKMEESTFTLVLWNLASVRG